MHTTRYLRQLNLFNETGQRLLRESKILIVGAGGLGSLAAAYLAAAGVGHITIIDDDIIELTNLTRQICYLETDCGELKVNALKRYIGNLNSNCNVLVEVSKFCKENAEYLIERHDLILDCCDNFNTKYLIGDYANNSDKPLVSASIEGFLG